MKTLFNFLSRIKDESIWLDPDGKYVYVEGTSWFDGIYYNPKVFYFYPNLINRALSDALIDSYISSSL